MSESVQDQRRKSAILRNISMVDSLPIYPQRGLTTSEIHQVLLDEKYVISRRTVQRDLEKLAEWAALDYEEDEQGFRRWFRDINKSDAMEVVPASEAFLLVLSEKLLRKTVPESMSKNLQVWLNKAEAKLSGKHLLSNWKSKINVVSDSYPIINDKHHIEEQYRKIIYDCVLKEEQIEVLYQSENSKSAKEYTLNPLGLIIRDQSHYLVATKEATPESPRLFLFHRISFAQSTYKDMRKPMTFTLAEYFAKNPTGWLLEDKTEQVTLKVKGYALDVLTHNKLATDQVLEKYDETWWRVSFNNYATYDLVSWILKFGGDVICESPVSVKKLVIKQLTESMKNYQ